MQIKTFRLTWQGQAATVKAYTKLEAVEIAQKGKPLNIVDISDDKKDFLVKYLLARASTITGTAVSVAIVNDGIAAYQSIMKATDDHTVEEGERI